VYVDIAATLEQLIGIAAPSGHEDAMISQMLREFERVGLSPRVDPLGNVVAPVRAPRPGYPRLVVFAHMDEVGFVVRKVEPDGFLRVQRVGGIPEKAMAAQDVVLLGTRGLVSGVIGTKAHHLTGDQEKARVVPVAEAYLDIGARSAADVHGAGIGVGTFATWAPRFQRHDRIVHAKALDNRAGCVILLGLAEAAGRLGGGAGVTLIASVQEEFSIRGIVPAVRAVAPDLLIGVDIVPSTDTPDTAGMGDVTVGNGPSIGYYSFHGRGTLNGLLPNPKFVRFIEEQAAAQGLPLQRHVFFGGLTDASYAQLEGPGIPAVDLGIPTRYTHSPVETCSLDDIRTAITVLGGLTAAIPAGFDVSRGGSAGCADPLAARPDVSRPPITLGTHG
jgi:putative aminopeptidase